MTVQAQNSAQYFAGPIEVGTTLSIVDFTFIDDSHVSAKIRNNPEVWRYGYDYDVYGAQTLERQITVWKRVEEGEVLAVYLDVPITQNIAPEEGGNFPASTNEFVLDKLTYISQMLYERVARSMQVSIDTDFDGTLPMLVPGKAIKINAAGTGLELSDLDPDKAVEEIQRYIQVAEKAANNAELSADRANTIVDSLQVRANDIYAACDYTEQVANDAVAAINNAAEHRLNSKEIGSLLFSSVPNTNTDLHIADGYTVTSEDPCWAALHNTWAKQKRLATDICTTYYKYASTNYSRMWYSTVQSQPDQHYGLQDVLNIPQGSVYLFDRAGTPCKRSTLSVQSYYKYELLNAVGDTSPYQYLLLPIEMGETQIAEPSKTDIDNFYAYLNDYRVGVKYDNIINLDILLPDVTSEYKRILITRKVADNTYYYYYKATPVKIQAFMVGSVADLNLGGQAGVQNQDTVPRPVLITTPVETFVVTTNNEFMSTAEFDANKELHDEFYTNLVDKNSDTTYPVEALTKDFNLWARNASVACPISNNFGWIDGFYSWMYKIPFNTHTGTKLDSIGNVVDIPLKTLDIEVVLQTAYNDLYQRVMWGDIDNTDCAGGIQLGIVENTRAQENGLDTKNRLEWLLPNANFNGWASVLRIPYELKEYTMYRTRFVLDEAGYYHVYFAEGENEYEEVFNDICPAIYMNARPNMQIGAAYKDEYCHFRGKIDMKRTHFIVNGVDKIAESLKYYAKDFNNVELKPYTSNDRPKLVEKTFANVYETNPESYTLINLIEDIDGWCAPTAANCGHWYGTGNNTSWITHEADNYIDIQGRFMTQSNWSAYQTMFQIMRQDYGCSPLRLCHVANSRVLRLALGRNGTNWMVPETDITHIVDGVTVGYALQDNTEYFVRLYADFSKKYEVVDGAHVLAETGTLYKYTLTLRAWNGPNDNAEPLLWELYTTYRFGSAPNDRYAWSGIGYDNYALGCTSFFNVYATSVNGKVAWKNNMHVVPRQADATVLPKIPNLEDNTENYVVVANGITEDVILATPQKQIDDYVDKEVLPEFNATMQTEIKTGLSSIQTATSQGLTKLAQASDAIRKKDCVPVSVPIYEYVSGASGYRIYSRTDLGYRCVQWGLSYNPNNQWVRTQFFKKYKNTDYFLATGMESTNNIDVWGYGDRTGSKYVDGFDHFINNSTTGNFWWLVEGFILDSEVPQGL